ncbi:unnamed protein product [Adineta steineri]|uniref:Uncharacterized protein n=1 Tax=Adineta steineri TaxID=433720 RepID=A0A813QXB6_9BILA|nr:unnamed protein product [Adineta steineri]CAF1430069.1 unnamed protein product [Adineta steineri]CAF4007047.1 unnamed protein product [Adineta steineri]CAF4032547.1 unnamed protein product [Adineta steineri]
MDLEFGSKYLISFLLGTTLQTPQGMDGLFLPSELHFPSIAHKLRSNTLRIIVWDHTPIEGSDFHFLRELGVRETPVLDDLIDMIVQDHENNMKRHKQAEYERATTTDQQFEQPDNSTTAEVQLKNLNDNQIDTNGLVDYVHFGPDGNSFLRSIGVCDRPSASVLAKLLLDRQSIFFANPKGLEKKTLAYLKCLIDLETLVTKISSIPDQTLVERLQNEPWCFAIVYTDNDSEQAFQIAAPKDVYLIDDYNLASCFRPWCPPNMHKLNKLYEIFGSRWLRDCVQTKFLRAGMVIFVYKFCEAQTGRRVEV